MTAGQAVVEIKGLKKRYRRSDPYAVNGVAFRIEAGQVFGLLEPNGAGKTTIVKMIAGLVRPDEGSIEVMGSAPGDPRTRASLGFAPEDPDFPSWAMYCVVIAVLLYLAVRRRQV